MQHIIIVGLGNPGKNYDNTRHNVGFMVIDAIVKHFAFPAFSTKFSSFISSKIIFGWKITLVKPQTFMNLSGSAVAKVLNFYKLPLENLIVIHDDLDLNLARTKMKIGGGSAGHNGLKSIDQHVGNNYYRLRIGIGRPNTQDVSSFVLSNFNTDEQEQIEQVIITLLQNFEALLYQMSD